MLLTGRQRLLRLEPSAALAPGSSASASPSPARRLPRRRQPSAVSAAAAASSDAPTPSADDTTTTGLFANPKLKLTILFVLWYAFNIVFNVYNKETLNAFPYPYLISVIELAATAAWMSVAWLLRIQPFPQLSKAGLYKLNSSLTVFFNKLPVRARQHWRGRLRGPLACSTS
jgi:hypothetical protein